MKIVYIAHPISGDVQNNLASIRKIVKDINLSMKDVVPFVPYYVDCVALDDSNPVHRQRGIKNDHAFFEKGVIEELWLYGNTISNGMKEEIKLALKHGIPIFTRSIGTTSMYQNILKEIDNSI